MSVTFVQEDSGPDAIPESLAVDISEALTGVQYLHPEEAAQVAGAISAALLSKCGLAYCSSSKKASADVTTAAPAAIASLASHRQPRVRAACYDSIVSQAAALTVNDAESAGINIPTKGQSDHGSRTEHHLFALLHPDVLGCMVDHGLNDPFCQDRAAEAIHACAQSACTMDSQASGDLTACNLRLVNMLPRLMCHLDLGSHITDTCLVIRSWQQQQMDGPSEYLQGADCQAEGLRRLDLLHCLQQLFHRAPSVRANATMHLQERLNADHTWSADLAGAWNASFEDAMDAIAAGSSSLRDLSTANTACSLR